MSGDRAADFRASAAECMLLASTSTDPMIRQALRNQAQALLRMANDEARPTAGSAPAQQPTAQQQQQVQPRGPEKGDK
jgi:hypothetical protein